MKISHIETINDSLQQFNISITSDELKFIIEEKLFNFNEALFCPKLSHNFPSEIEIALIGSILDQKIVALNDAALETFQIRYIKLATVVHQTFLDIIEDFEDVNAYKKAITDFALKKVENEDYDSVSSEELEALNVDKATSKLLYKDAKVNALNFINKLFNGSSESTLNKVEYYLKTKKIPFKLSENAFFYSATFEESHYNIEININESKGSISLYSSVALEPASQEHFQIILENINNLNLSIPSGNYEYSNELKMLYFKVHCFVTDAAVFLQLENLIQESETRIQSIHPFLFNLTIQSESP